MEKHSRFFALLRSLRRRDMRQLYPFIQLGSMGLVARDSQVLDVILEEFNTSRNFSEDRLEKRVNQAFFSHLAKDSARREWNHTKSRLTAVINNFIAYKELIEAPYIKNELLLNYYRKNKLTDNLKRQIKQSQKELNAGKKDWSTSYYRYQLQDKKLSLDWVKRKEDLTDLDKMNEALEAFFIENKLNLMLEYYNRHRIVNIYNADDAFLDLILQKKVPIQGIGSQLYLALYHMMTESENLLHYQQAKSIFLAHQQQFKYDYRITVCLYLMNQCIYYCHGQQTQFAAEYLEYIKYLIEDEAYMKDRGLSFAMYVNSVYMAQIDEQLDWAEDFVTNYTQLLDHKDPESIRELSYASIAFSRGAFKKAAVHLATVSSADLYFKITQYKLTIKILYEDRSLSSLKDRLATFKRYIERQENLHQSRKDKNHAFTKAVKQLIDPKSKKTPLSPSDFMILDYRWLKEKWET